MWGRLLSGLLSLMLVSAAAAQDSPHHHQSGLPATAAEADAAPLYHNLGSLHHSITVANPEVQKFFDQGLRLGYAFNHDEAIASYREGIRRDSTCAMCYWGVAYAMGPNINAPMDTAVVQPAWEAIQKAKALASKVTSFERELIDATALRYAPDAASPRPPLDSAYARALKELARKYPRDPEAQSLYAESLMNLSPWNYWIGRGTQPRPGTLEVVSTLERTIKRYPNHPGACHFYIHIVEASTTPGRALPCAERLAKLMPGAGHLVHMPSHIYMRVGRYDLVAEHNHQAVAEDETFIQDRKPAGSYKYTYYPHNYHMLWAGLMNLGRGEEAIAASHKLIGVVPVDVVAQVAPLEYFYPAYYWSLARFSKWDQLLAEPAPAPQLRYTTGMWQYTRGLAFAATGRPEEAQAAHDSLAAITEATAPEAPAGINSARKLLALAERHLAGKIAAARGDSTAAASAYQEAIVLEDDLLYDEPPAWYYPIRQELGELRLAQGKASEAEKLFRQDLVHYPNNGWSLHGLALSLKAQKRNREAEKVEAEFREVWEKADVRLGTS